MKVILNKIISFIKGKKRTCFLNAFNCDAVCGEKWKKCPECIYKEFPKT